MKLIHDLTGKKFGRLTVLSLDPKRVNTKRQWKCLCECGNVKVVRGSCLLEGITKSCGCLYKESASKRGNNWEPGSVAAFLRSDFRSRVKELEDRVSALEKIVKGGGR